MTKKITRFLTATYKICLLKKKKSKLNIECT